jgi:DNA-binding Lrp family transcriptional regulator
MSAPAPTADEARLALAWRVTPATVDFILRTETASRNTRDLVDGLLFAAIQAANVSAINNDSDLQVAYATLQAAPPDELRRPVSVSAIAHSLRMPFETARRRVQALVKIGALEVTPKGILVSHQSLGHQEFLANVFLRHEMLRAFYLQVRDLGLPLPGAAGPGMSLDDPPIRLTNRLIWEYMLRVADVLGAAVGDATNGIILLAMVRGNTDRFGADQLAAWVRDPLALAVPVRNRRLAEQLNFSSETMRRYVIALEAQGLCVRGPRGLVAIASPKVRSSLDGMVLDNLANLQRMFSRLRQFGVLSMWDAVVDDPTAMDRPE